MSAGTHCLGTRLGDGLERCALVAHIPLHRFDQVGNKIVAASELYVDIGPGVARSVAQADEVVEGSDQEKQQQRRNRCDGDKAVRNFQLLLPVRDDLGKPRSPILPSARHLLLNNRTMSFTNFMKPLKIATQSCPKAQ